MGVCIDKLPHECGSRRGLQVFADEETGKVDGFCFSCCKYIRHPYGKEKTVDDVELPPEKTQEEIEEEIADILGYPTVDIPSRKLREDSLAFFDVRVALSEEDGATPTHTYFPITKNDKLSGYYVKTLSEPSHKWSVGDVRDGDLFGWDKAKKSGAYRLIVTEGFEDAVAVHRLYSLYGKPEYMPAIVSLTNGVNSIGKSLTRSQDDIKRLFREVVFCFDGDEVGQEAVQKAMLVYPQAKSVILPAKDANQCLMEGIGKAAYKALAFDAQKPKNTRLIMGSALHKKAREPAKYGELTWPWEKMQRLLRGIRLGETIYVGAGVKMGKSEIGYSLTSHFIAQDGVPVFGAWPEESEDEAYKAVAGHTVGYNFRDPEKEFNYEKYDKAGEIIGDKLIALDLYQHMGWDTLKNDIIYAANEGCKVVMIDPITNLTAGMQAGDANAFLTGMTRDLSSLARDMGFTAFLYCHLKAPEGNIGKDVRRAKYSKGEYIRLGNCPHERGGDVLSNQFVGSRAMMQACNLMLGLEGNRDDELPEDIRATRWLSILEDRKFGNSDSVRLFRNPHSTQFTEV